MKQAFGWDAKRWRGSLVFGGNEPGRSCGIFLEGLLDECVWLVGGERPKDWGNLLATIDTS